MAAHRDADVWRWAVAQRMARKLLRGDSNDKRAGVTERVVGRQQVFSVSAAGGAAAVREMLKKRSEVGHG